MKKVRIEKEFRKETTILRKMDWLAIINLEMKKMSENNSILKRILSRISMYNIEDSSSFMEIQSFVNDEKTKIVFPKGNYHCEISTGVGNNPICPWFGIFLDENCPTKGFYVVYLFDSEKKEVFLTLLFGTEKLSLTQISVISNWTKARLGKNDWEGNSVNLKWNKGRPKKYERSAILSIKYHIEDLDSLDMENDFFRMLDYYEKLLIICELNNFSELLQKITISKTKKDIDCEMKEFARKRRMISEEMYKDALSTRNELGKLGEMFIKKSIEKEFIDQGRKVFSVFLMNSIDVGAGYDIITKWNDDQGRVHTEYCEVKTTTGSFGNPFFMSQNEKRFLESHMDEYFLFRVFNYKEIDEPYGDYKKISGAELLHDYSFDELPSSYSVRKA